MKEGRQIRRWNDAAREWSAQEASLVSRLGRPGADKLLMNSTSTRLGSAPTAPPTDTGTGGTRPAYWVQPIVTKTGLRSTLTSTERGTADPAQAIEYVSTRINHACIHCFFL